MEKSRTIVLYSIMAAIDKAEDFLFPNRKALTLPPPEQPEWAEKNDKQKLFFDIFNRIKQYEAGHFSQIEEIKSIASRYYGEINDFLQSNGFDIELSPFDPNSQFGVAAIFQLLAYWRRKAEYATITVENSEQYPGIEIEDAFKILKSSNHEDPIVFLQTFKDQGGTLNDYRVIMSGCDKVPADDFELLDIAMNDIIAGVSLSCPGFIEDYDSVRFPMVDLDIKKGLDWLISLEVTDHKGTPWRVAEAIQQDRLQINQLGLKAESAVAMCFDRCCAVKEPHPFIINKPFVFCICHKSCDIPIFIAYVSTDAWKDPGHIAGLGD